MEEIFKDISNKTKDIAKFAWRLAMTQESPIKAAEFLNRVTNYYDRVLTDEEIDFLRFYFNMKMEAMKE